MADAKDQMHSHLEIATASIRIFANDGTIDHQELDRLLALALRDGELDAEERRVLNSIFSRAEESGLSESVRQRMRDVRAKHGI